MTHRTRLLTVGLIALGAYAALIGWFAWTDVYGSHFFDSGRLIVGRNLLRIAFAIVLAWLVYAPGAVLLAVIAGFPAVRELKVGEGYALGFFTGAGLWHLVLFGIGFAGLYQTHSDRAHRRRAPAFPAAPGGMPR